MNQPEERYSLLRETDGSISICDRQIIESERDQRIVTGLGQDQAAELLKSSIPGQAIQQNEQPV
jgi:hypothetical protein